MSAEELLDRAWDEHTDPFTNTVRVTMMTLRRKLGDPPVIETVTGAGYRIRCSSPDGRLRLTLWYTGLFLVAGAMLLALNYFLVDRSTNSATRCASACRPRRTSRDERSSGGGRRRAARACAWSTCSRSRRWPPCSLSARVADRGQSSAPVHRMTTTARHLSESNLHERIDLDGPDDELKELADTFDAMLDRFGDGILRPASLRRRRVARAANAIVDHPRRSRCHPRRSRCHA